MSITRDEPSGIVAEFSFCLRVVVIGCFQGTFFLQGKLRLNVNDWRQGRFPGHIRAPKVKERKNGWGNAGKYSGRMAYPLPLETIQGRFVSRPFLIQLIKFSIKTLVPKAGLGLVAR